MKCVKTGLYYNARMNKMYYVERLKNGGIFVKTFINNNGRTCVQNCQTIKSGEVFFNSGNLVQNLNKYLLDVERLQPAIRDKVLAERRLRVTYG